MNQPNKEGQPSAEAGEGRAQTRENIAQSHMHPTQSGKRMSQGLDGVRKAAKERKQERFTALLHHLNVELLRDSFYALQRKASPGVDGVTWQEYETGLEDRLVDLHDRVHRGAYRAKPSRRVFIPKADGRQRPLGIAALEDKIVQQAVVTILNQIYEVDFKGFSYGFRPGRSPFDNQVFVDEFFRPIQPFGISDLRTRTERRFMNAAGRPCSQSCTWLYEHRA